MATFPIIQSVGSTSGAGTPGVGRNDLVIGETVTLSDTVVGNVGSSYLWSFDDQPIGSTATITGPTTATPTFSPDITGSYRIKCVCAGVYTSYLIIAVPLDKTGARIPSFQEELQYNGAGNTKGWHEAQTVFMREVDDQLGTGGSGGDFKAVDTISALSALSLTGLTNGTSVFVRSLKDVFILDTASTATVDTTNFLVVATSGSGRWLRSCQANYDWIGNIAADADVNWYVNPSTGNNENTGASSGQALKTFSELDRRVHGLTYPTSGTVIVNVLASSTDTQDPIKIRFNVTSAGGYGGVQILGTLGTPTVTGTLTGYTTLDETAVDGGQPYVIEDTSRTWTTYVGKFISFYDGVDWKSNAWIAADLGSNQARISTPISFGTTEEPVVGYGYRVYDLLTVTDIYVETVGNWIDIRYLNVTSSLDWVNLHNSNTNDITLYFSSITTTGDGRSFGCPMFFGSKISTEAYGTTLYSSTMFGCLVYGTNETTITGKVELLNWTLFQGSKLILNNVVPVETTEAQTLCIFDTPSSEYLLTFSGSILLDNISVFGSNTGSNGVAVSGKGDQSIQFNLLNLDEGEIVSTTDTIRIPYTTLEKSWCFDNYGNTLRINDSCCAHQGQVLVSDEAIVPFRLIRQTTGGVVKAQADTAGHILNVCGVTYSTCDAASNVIVNKDGPLVIEFDGVPTVPAIAYVSPTTAGLATTTEPGSNKLRVGQVVGVVTGNFGVVMPEFDLTEVSSSGGTDEKVKVSSNDTTAGYIEDKILAGTNVSLTTQNEGGNETRTINVASAAPSGSASGQLSGTYPGPSVAGLTETGGPTALTIGAVADGQYLQRSGSTIVGSTSTTDNKVKVDSADTPAGYLDAKVVAGTDVTVTKSVGPDKTLTLDLVTLSPDPHGTFTYATVTVDTKGRVTSASSGTTPTDEKVKVSSNDTTAGDLETKLLAGTNVAMTTQNDGGNETRTINVASAPPSGSASGQLSGTYPGPSVAGITETSGPTALTIGAITDGQYLKRNGSTIVSAAVSGGGIGGSGDTLVNTIPFGEHESWASATPLIVSRRQINPNNYTLTGTTVSAVFRAAAANGNTGITTHVRLYNVTDGETLATLNFTSTALTIQSATLTIGSSSGNLKQADKSYEAEVYVDSPGSSADTIELGSAELRIINTVT